MASPQTDDLAVSLNQQGNSLNFKIESTEDVSLAIECLELMNRKRKLNNTEKSLKNIEVQNKI